MPSWKEQAACQGMDTGFFYPERGTQSGAIAICLECPVRLQCLNAGLNERHGIWGGKNERERRKIRKTRWREEAV